MSTPDTFSPQDTAMMRQALQLAGQGRFSTSPNPRVGCVIARGGQIVGQGFHLRAGEAHAEVHALRQAGSAAEGATAYVTLEPCAHHGRTPPCAEALVQAGVSRVVAAMRDPNPLVGGKGFDILRNAGISVSYGLLEAEARELNRGFLSRIERGRPFVKLKTAASLDGKTALSDGRSRWITGEAARADVQAERAESCAVLTGIGTVLADDPQLNVRLFPTLRQPLRIVLDSRLRTPVRSRLVQDNGSTLIVTLADTAGSPQAACPNVRLLRQPENPAGGINLPDLLAELARQGIGELMVEAGRTLTGAWLAQDLADEIVLYQSPKILGGRALGLTDLPENPAVLARPADWHTRSVHCLDGQDIKWVLRRNPG